MKSLIKSIATLLLIAVAASSVFLLDKPASVSADDSEYDYWHSMAASYTHDHLDSPSRLAWDVLDEALMDILLSDADYGEYVTVNMPDGGILFPGENLEHIKQLFFSFRDHNPQYFFMKAVVSYKVEETAGGIKLIAYYVWFNPDMNRGQVRADAKRMIRQELAEYNSGITDGMRPEEVVKTIHDKICSRISYGGPADQLYTNIYGTLTTDVAVCAGYSRLFEALVNMNGVDCLYVTSTNHAWNIVDLHGQWFYVDVTWDDDTTDIVCHYKYYLCSQETFDQGDTSVAHTIEDKWNGFLPAVSGDALDEYPSYDYYRRTYYTSRYIDVDGVEYMIVNDYEDNGGYQAIYVDGNTANLRSVVSRDGRDYTVINYSNPVRVSSKPSMYQVMPTSVTEPGVAGFVERLYTVALGRASDPAGKADWVNRVTVQGYSGADLAEGFLYSDEFLGKSMTNSAFLNVLYVTFFNRLPDTAGKNNWLHAMATGAGKRDVIRGFINSTEWANLCLTYGISSGGTGVPNITVTPSADVLAFAERLYTKCLGRESDPVGLNDWATQLASMGISGSACAHGFFFSDEFLSHNYDNETYVTRLYRTFLGREPDAAGFADWVGQLASGASRESVFRGFAGSAEWAAICADYGIVK